jgi:hypothetical protein
VRSIQSKGNQSQIANSDLKEALQSKSINMFNKTGFSFTDKKISRGTETQSHLRPPKQSLAQKMLDKLKGKVGVKKPLKVKI